MSRPPHASAASFCCRTARPGSTYRSCRGRRRCCRRCSGRGGRPVRRGLPAPRVATASYVWLFLTRSEARISASSAQDGPTRVNDENMASKSKQDREMRDHFDFSGGVRGKYAARYAEGANVVVLAPNVADVFPDSIAVNEALRTLLRLSSKTVRTKAAPKKRGPRGKESCAPVVGGRPDRKLPEPPHRPSGTAQSAPERE